MANEITVSIKGDDQLSGVLGKATEKAKGFGGALKDVATTAGGFLVGGAIQAGLGEITGFMSGAVDAASGLSESMNAVNKVFGSASTEVRKWGEENANAFGLSQRAFNELATPLGAMLANSGMEMGVVGEQTIEITKRAADMASVFNTDVSEALTAIQAGLRGEADPLERFGVGMSAAAVEAKALSMGLGKVEVDAEKVHVAQLGAAIANTKYQQEVAKSGRGSLEAAQKEKALISANEALEKAMAGSNAELTDQEKMQARIALLMEQTNAVAGDFTETSDGFANSQRIAAARTEELQAKLGEKLIPVTQRLTAFKLKLTEAIVDKALPAFDKFQAFMANTVRPALEDVATWVGDHVVPKLHEMGDWIMGTGVPALQELAGWLREHMGPNLEKVKDILIDLIPKFREMGETLVEKFQEVKPELQAFAEFMMDKVIPAILFVADKLTLVLVPAFKAIMESYALTIHAAGDVITWFKNIGSTAADVATTLSGAFVEAFNTIVRIWNGLEFTLPGGVVGTALFGPLAGKTFGTPDLGLFRTGDTTGGDKQFGGGGVRRFAAGGMVTRPTLALLGEGGQPEMVTPMGRGPGGGPTIIVQALDARSAAEGVVKALEHAYQRGLMRRPT